MDRYAREKGAKAMQGMRDLLRGSLGKSLRTLTPLDRLAAAWPVVCGPVLAARGELLLFEEGRLSVRVVDAAWREQLRSSRDRLRSELARVASVELREIHFEGGSERPRRTVRAPGSGAGSTSGPKPGRRPERARRPPSKNTPNPTKSPRGAA